MSRRHSGFTLIEVMVALVITGLVVALSWAALQGGIDTTARLASQRDRGEAFTTTRALVATALRHALPGVTGGEPTFVVTRRLSPGGGSSDSVVFLTRGITEPHGTSAAWRATVWTAGDTLRLQATPVAAAARVVSAAVPGIISLQVRALGRGAFASWTDGWGEAAVAPTVVQLAYTEAAGGRVTQVQRLGLERLP